MPIDWRSVRVEFVVPAELLDTPGVADELLFTIRDAVVALRYAASVQDLRVSLHDLPDF